MDKYKQTFEKLNRLKEGALIPFTVIGDPDYKTSLEIIKVLSNRGDILELGLPFSDPIADGSTIQKADVRALKHIFDTNKIFDFLKKVRKFTNKPIGLLVYYNLIYQYGLERFCSKAKECGVDSILVADLSLEESYNLVKAAKMNNIATVFLVTQLTNTKRLRKILKKSKGFVYIVNVLGVTGTRINLEKATLDLIKRVRPHTKLPLCAGFGISKPEHVKAVLKAGADGVIVGSAIVDLIAKNINNKGKMLDSIYTYVKSMKTATRIKTKNRKI